MESILIIPLLTYLYLPQRKDAIAVPKLAILASVLFFIRIDSIILTLPLIGYRLYTNLRYKSILKDMLSLILYFVLPVAGYVGYNYKFYNTPFPVSGLAKSVEAFSGLQSAAIDSFLNYMPYGVFNIIITTAAVLVLPFLRFTQRRYVLIFILAMILFYLQNSLRSDWGLWAWYFYPIPALSFLISTQFPAAFFTHTRSMIARFSMYLAQGLSLAAVFIGSALILLYTFPAILNRAQGGRVDILHLAGFEIKNFEKYNKGVYAMGDRAGIAGYLIASPLIQLEGLVMDKQYLEDLKKAEDLIQLLKKYSVDYYIASNPVKLNDSTYIVNEPVKSNGFSRKIRDTIDWKIEHRFTLQQRGIIRRNVVESTETIIYKVPK
jgi:hypothetical protein